MFFFSRIDFLCVKLVLNGNSVSVVVFLVVDFISSFTEVGFHFLLLT